MVNFPAVFAERSATSTCHAPRSSLNTAFRTMPGKAIVKCLQHQCCSMALMAATCLILKIMPPRWLWLCKFRAHHPFQRYQQTLHFLLGELVPCTPKNQTTQPRSPQLPCNGSPTPAQWFPSPAAVPAAIDPARAPSKGDRIPEKISTGNSDPWKSPKKPTSFL